MNNNIDCNTEKLRVAVDNSFSISPQNLLRYRTLLLLAIINFSVLCVSVVVGYKLVLFMGLTFSVGIYIFPISYVCKDIIAEIYGYRIAKIVILSTLPCLFLFSFFVTLFVNLEPSTSWHDQAAYVKTLGNSMRLSLAIIGSLIISDFLNAFILTKWKIILMGRYYWLRSFGSTIIAEAVDTFIGFGIAFVGILSLSGYLEISTNTIFAKLTWSFLYILPSCLIVAFIKNKLKLDIFDYWSNYSPFPANSKLEE